MPAALELVSQAGRAAVLVAGAALVLQGEMTLGVLLVVLSYLQQLFDPMKALARLSSTTARGQAGAERIDEVLRSPLVVRERPHAVVLPPLRGDVRLTDARFSYHAGQTVLGGVSMHAPAGQVVALGAWVRKGQPADGGPRVRLRDGRGS